MSDELERPTVKIRTLAQKASRAYKAYKILKRDGTFRQIHHPSKQLKALQRWLLQNFINDWPIHASALAYRHERSIADNARAHLSSNYLLRMDFLNFFPSITRHDVLTYLATRTPASAKDWLSADRDLFADLVCRDDRLTIGAPTSPALSNALCFDLDRKLAGLAQGNDSTYTRYADDLFFSTSTPDVLAFIPNEVGKILKEIPLPSALQVNTSKTRHSSKKGRRQVTGLILSTANTVGIGRKRKRYIRSLIFKYDTLTDIEKSTLAGLLAFAKSIEPDFINALVLKYGYSLVSQARYPVKV